MLPDALRVVRTDTDAWGVLMHLMVLVLPDPGVNSRSIGIEHGLNAPDGAGCSLTMEDTTVYNANGLMS